MCELFGASLKRRADLREYLSEFYTHSVNHPHGWGLMSENGGETEIVKECVCASESKILGGIIERLSPQKTVLAHIRYATVGSKRDENSHPFSALDLSGRRWTLIHNGTIYSGVSLMKYYGIQTGETDSERVFLYLMDCVNAAIEKNKNRPLGAQERFEIADALVNKLAHKNKLNLMIYDGEYFYVHKNMRGTLSYKQTENGTLFSTQPLSDGGWQDLPMCRLFVYKNGDRVFAGTPHCSEFIQTLDYITEFDAMNI